MTLCMLNDLYKLTATDFKPNSVVELVDLTMTIMKCFDVQTLLKELDEGGVQLRVVSGEIIPQKQRVFRMIDLSRALPIDDERSPHMHPIDELKNGPSISPTVSPEKAALMLNDLFKTSATDLKPNNVVELVDFTVTIMKSFDLVALLKELDENRVHLRGGSGCFVSYKGNVRSMVNVIGMYQYFEERQRNVHTNILTTSTDQLQNGYPNSSILQPEEEYYEEEEYEKGDSEEEDYSCTTIHTKRHEFRLNNRHGVVNLLPDDDDDDDEFDTYYHAYPGGPRIPMPPVAHYYILSDRDPKHDWPDNLVPCCNDSPRVHSASPQGGELDLEASAMEQDANQESMDILDTQTVLSFQSSTVSATHSPSGTELPCSESIEPARKAALPCQMSPTITDNGGQAWQVFQTMFFLSMFINAIAVILTYFVCF